MPIQRERHGEFSGCPLCAPGLRGEPFGEPVVSLLPEGWRAILSYVAGLVGCLA